MMHVEAIIITTLITTAQIDKRQIIAPLPDICYEDCSKYIISRNRCLHILRLANQYTISETDQALLIEERDGKPAACPQDSPFSSAFLQCEDCLSEYKDTTPTALAPDTI